MEKQYLIEFYQVGNSVKVSAMDPDTGMEVSIVGAPSTPRHQLSRLAVRKLKYMLAKRDQPSEE